MTTSEKVAYLKGLAEGLGFDKESKEGRILDAILDILEDVAHDIEDLEDNAYELGEAIDQVSDDLSDIEDIVYDLDDEYGTGRFLYFLRLSMPTAASARAMSMSAARMSIITFEAVPAASQCARSKPKGRSRLYDGSM